jgi:hypothetical protein
MEAIEINAIENRKSRVIIDGVGYSRLNNDVISVFILECIERHILNVRVLSSNRNYMTIKKTLQKRGLNKRIKKMLLRQFKKQYIVINVEYIQYSSRTEEVFIIGRFNGIPSFEHWILSATYSDILGSFMLDSIYLPVK